MGFPQRSDDVERRKSDGENGGDITHTAQRDGEARFQQLDQQAVAGGRVAGARLVVERGQHGEVGSGLGGDLLDRLGEFFRQADGLFAGRGGAEDRVDERGDRGRNDGVLVVGEPDGFKQLFRVLLLGPHQVVEHRVQLVVGYQQHFLIGVIFVVLDDRFAHQDPDRGLARAFFAEDDGGRRPSGGAGDLGVIRVGELGFRQSIEHRVQPSFFGRERVLGQLMVSQKGVDVHANLKRRDVR